MKLSSLVLLLPAAEAAVIWPRQFGSSLKVANVKKLTPEVRKEATHVIQSLGPISLKGRKANEQDSGQQNFMFMVPRDAFCRDCTVLKGHIGLANLDGIPIVPKKDSGVYIHHILTFDTTKRANSFVSGCMGGGITDMVGSKFIGSGEDNNNVPVWYTNKDSNKTSGFHIGPSDSFMMNADLVSLNTGNSQIYITMELEYLSGRVGSDAQESLLSVDVCGGQRLRTNPSGPTNSTSGAYTFKESGTLLLAKGHVHAGGDRVDVFINKKLVCSSKAIYGGQKGDQAINEMTICPEIKVKTGDVMTFLVAYDVSKHPVRHESHGLGAGMPDIMGMLDVVFARS